ncbi:MAG: hypothetical protein JO127_07990 [Caulobacteraceae bacterium]|nr:hypothetical protein [Caulobacteraceae bacterium]
MTTAFGLDSTVLAGWFQSYFGGGGTGVAPLGAATTGGGLGTSGAATAKYAPTPPWDPTIKATPENKLAHAALSGAKIINPAAAKLDIPGAGAAYKNLFALYQGLNTLYALADQASGAGVSGLQAGQFASAFQEGMGELSQFVAESRFGSLRVTTGTTASSETSTASTPSQPSEYQTVALNTSGDADAVVPAFQGSVQFNVDVRKASGAHVSVAMNLDDMGSTPRTIANVVDYLNGQMKAAGVATTFSINRIAAPPRTISVDGKTVTLAESQTQWGLEIDTNSVETVSLSAPQTAPAVYVGQMVGNQTASGTTAAPIPADAQSQLLKFQAGGAPLTPPAPQPHGAPDQLFVDTLGAPVKAIQATAAAPDGSVYVLADVSAAQGGEAGGQDVALMKYDSAGQLLFQTNLGSASSASGFAIAVSADGSQVVVAGRADGPLSEGQSQLNPDAANGFVAAFNAKGEQLWRQEDDGVFDNQASAVAFGADGKVYVTGQAATGAAGLAGPQSPSNGYLRVFSTTGAQLSDVAFGAGGASAGAGVAVDGSSVYVASVQNGAAVVSQYDVTDPSAPVLVASRNLGDLQGGSLAGVAVENGTVYVAGSTHNGALSAGATTSAYSGGLDAFAAALQTGLAPSASDAIAYYGGAADDVASAMTVSGGKVYLAGSSTGALPGLAAVGAKDGFVAALDVASGAADWSQRFTGLDGKVAPDAIAVAPTGASILDQLGLPQGVVDAPVSDLLTATTPVRAGDSFSVGTGAGGMAKITVDAGETVASLAQKIAWATGAGVNVSAHQNGQGVSLQIKPLDAFSTVVLANGPAGSDALSELGLKPGILFQTKPGKGGVVVPADGKGAIYGLGLSANLNLGSASDISRAKAQLTAAMSVVKSAYQALKTAATPANVLALQQATANGKTPAYLTAQIANYKAALSRLTAGQTSSTILGA